MDRVTILSKIIDEQNKVLESMKNTAAQFETASDLDESEARDIDDLSHQDEAKDMQLRYESLLADAQATLAALQGAQGGDAQSVGQGSIVDLGEKIIYLGASVPAFEVDGKELLGISGDAPVFGELEGKKVGDSVKIGQDSFKIKQIL